MKISLKQHQHAWIYFIGLVLMAMSLPLSKFTMSVAQFILVGNWLWEGNFRNKWQTIKSNKLIWVLLSIYLLHVVGVLWSTDLAYAAKDLRIKLPLLALPILIGTSAPLDFKRFRILLLLFAGAVFAGTVVSMYYYLGFSGEHIYDPRYLSRFISHIRFSLLIVISIIALLWMILLQGNRFSVIVKLLMALAILWFSAFLFILDTLNGIAALVITVFCTLAWYAMFSKSKLLKTSLLALVVGIPILAVVYFSMIVKQHYGIDTKEDLSALDSVSAAGTYYYHNKENKEMENGHYVWIYIADGEIQKEWRKRSDLPFDGLDKKNNPLYGTVLRYMSSRGLRKDSVGISQLSDEEIAAIENGISSHRYFDKLGIDYRIEQTLYEFDNYMASGNPSGHSTTQRLEFWKAATGIIKANPIIGVGTGDLNAAYDQQYELMNSLLEEKYRFRAHNQFLSIGVAFGLLGLAWFIFSLAFPFITTKFNTGYLYTLFILITAVSMLTEDTLETQAGVSFFAFFNTLFLFAQPGIEKLKRFQFLK